MSQILVLTFFLIMLVVVPILATKETRKINKEINIENWSIKPVMSNSKNIKFTPKTIGISFLIFAVVFTMLNILKII